MKGGYNRVLVEQLLPAVWDQDYAYGMRNPMQPDPDMPKATPDKKKGSSLNAHLADIRSAWRRADLSLVERQCLLLRYGLDWTLDEMAGLNGEPRSTPLRRSDRGVGKLTAYLNGEEYSEGYDTDLEPGDVIV